MPIRVCRPAQIECYDRKLDVYGSEITCLRASLVYNNKSGGFPTVDSLRFTVLSHCNYQCFVDLFTYIATQSIARLVKIYRVASTRIYDHPYSFDAANQLRCRSLRPASRWPSYKLCS